MCYWQRLEGKFVLARALFVQKAYDSECALLHHVEIYNNVTGLWDAARDHVWTPPRSMWRYLKPNTEIVFEARVNCYITEAEPDNRRLNFRSIELLESEAS